MTVIDLGYQPRAWQHEAHLGLAGKRWGALVVHRRGGKTILAILHLIDRACRCERGDGRFAYIAPFLKQAKAIAWSYLKTYATRIPGTAVHEGELRVVLRNGSEIRLHGADNPDALRGIYLDGVVLDEVAQLSEDLWDSVLRPALADRAGWALLMGTPSGINLLSKVYFGARDNPEWYAGCYTVDQTDALPRDEIDALRRELTATAFSREMLCDFSAAVDNALLSVTDVEEAGRRCPRIEDYHLAPRVLGIDVARQGDDRSVIFRRQGIASWTPQVMHGQDSMSVAAQVTQHIAEWQPDAVFIDGSGGYGAGVIDRLRQLGHQVVEVQFGGKADSPVYANKRSEMWFKMAEWVKAHGAIPPSQELRQDLCAPTYGHDGQDRLLLEAKDRIKARGLPSPDLADALALTFAHHVAPRRTLQEASRSAGRALTEYDPLA